MRRTGVRFLRVFAASPWDVTEERQHGGAYLYFFCRGRQQGNGCRQRYVLVDAVEDAIARFYSTVQLEPERIEKLREWLRVELEEKKTSRELEAKRQKLRLERLTAKQDKLMQALYADAVPMEVFKREQKSILRDKTEAGRQLAGAQERFEATERAIEQAIDLAEHLDEAYRRASEEERRLLNQAIFERIWVKDSQVSGATLTAPAATLLAHDLTERMSREAQPPDLVFSGAGSNLRDLVPLIRAYSNPRVQVEIGRLHKLVASWAGEQRLQPLEGSDELSPKEPASPRCSTAPA